MLLDQFRGSGEVALPFLESWLFAEIVQKVIRLVEVIGGILLHPQHGHADF